MTDLLNCYINKLILTSEPLNPKWNRENYIFNKKPKWNYMDSCMIRALLMQEEPPLDYIIKFVDSYVDENGAIPTLNPKDFNLDNICGGVNLISLYDITHNEKYRTAYEYIYNSQLKIQPRLECGNYWHKAIYPYQIWLDGAYMTLPFLALYGKITGNNNMISDALNQVKNIKKYMRDDETGLYYHGYDETKQMFWADKKTGLSSQFWLRSNGWLSAGLVDLYEITESAEIGEMLKELLESLNAYITPENMLLQLPTRPELSGNYPETSGTLLFAYSSLKAYRLKIVSEKIAESGARAIETVKSKYIDNSGDVPILKNICLMGGLGGEKRRDGSAECYLSERIIENDAKGIAPLFMAAAEYKKYKSMK